jgi:uncharacterized protein (DUF1330 family)
MCNGHWLRVSRGVRDLTGRPISKSLNKIGSLNPKWRGGEIGDGHGRVLIYSPNHPRPSMYKTHVYRYRLVMEKHLGRYLVKGEIVHHKNGIKNDDRIENLELMTQSEHARLHFKEMWAARKQKQGY